MQQPTTPRPVPQGLRFVGKLADFLKELKKLQRL